MPPLGKYATQNLNFYWKKCAPLVEALKYEDVVIKKNNTFLLNIASELQN